MVPPSQAASDQIPDALTQEHAGSQDLERLSRLLALLAQAFTWAFVVGLWEASVKELKLKKHVYPPKSIFRPGLNLLCRLVTNFERFDLVVWQKVIKPLSCSQVIAT